MSALDGPPASGPFRRACIAGLLMNHRLRAARRPANRRVDLHRANLRTPLICHVATLTDRTTSQPRGRSRTPASNAAHPPACNGAVEVACRLSTRGSLTTLNQADRWLVTAVSRLRTTSNATISPLAGPHASAGMPDIARVPQAPSACAALGAHAAAAALPIVDRRPAAWFGLSVR